MPPLPNHEPHDSCHHRLTTEGDTFGGIATSAEVREEEIPRYRLQTEPPATEGPTPRTP